MQTQAFPMTADPTSLLRRYRETRDPEVLGRLFDAAAPQLLRLAVHLAGDAADAEDLVQATFLAVIEGAERFEPGAEALPWLGGILANKAKYARRSAARELDPERLERLATSPVEEAAHAEFSGELAKALDGLEESYRQPLVLRLRHGMKTADIAHVLGLSPGAVRVRLSRGMAQLRKTLPIGLAPAALLFTPERGLAAVRELVLAEASVAAAVVKGASILTTGGVLVTNKIVLGAAALLIAALASMWYRAASGSTRPSATAPGVSEELSLVEPATSARTPTPADERRAEPGIAPSSTNTATLDGLVLDAATGEPLADALIEVYLREEMLVSGLKEREYPYLLQDNYRGVPWPLGAWPRLVFPKPIDTVQGQVIAWNLTDAQLLDQEPVIVATRPLSTSTPIASTRSDAEGRFQVPRPDDIGVVVCSRADYGRRIVPVMEPPPELVIKMRRDRVLSGHLIDTEGQRVAASIELLFYGAMDREGDQRSNMEAWIGRTEPDGSFAIALPAKDVYARALTPGWFVESTGMHPEHQQRWAFPPAYEAGEPYVCACGRVEPVRWVVRRVPILRITAADTGEPIEHFEMTMREMRDGYVRWAGRYYAPEGIYKVISEPGELDQLENVPLELTVWAKGYRPCKVSVPDLPAESEVRFALKRGQLPSLTGVVTEAGRAIAGARVSIQPGKPLWSRELRSIVGTVTDVLGRFELSAPGGDYALIVTDEERVLVQPFALTEDTYLEVDLARLGEVIVEVRDSLGAIQVDHTVAIGADDGRQEILFTKEDGHVRFQLLQPGKYRIHVPNVSTRGSFAGGVVEDVEVEEYGSKTVQVTIPALTGPIYSRIVTDVPQDFAQWQAKVGQSGWVAIQPDGTIPLDMQRIEWRALEVEAPGGRRWVLDIPEPVPQGFEFRIALGGPKYSGVLRSLENREPVAGLTVRAWPILEGGNGTAEISVVSDQHGRFTLDCEAEVPHRLWLESVGSGQDGFAFTLEVAPRPDSTSIEVFVPRMSEGRVSGFARKTIRGKVLRSASGTPLLGTRVTVVAIQRQAHGLLEVGTSITTDADGSYAIRVPDVDSYCLNVYEQGAREAALVQEWTGQPGRDETRDLTVP